MSGFCLGLAKRLFGEESDLTDSGERVTPLCRNDCYYAHLSLYFCALPWVQNTTVLDAGSGAGYGAAYLADHGARFVHGIDVSAKAVTFSRQHCSRPNLQFQVMDLEKIEGFGDHSFDVVMCSNVLEHLRAVPVFLHTIGRLLQPQGAMIVAVPPIVDANLRAQDLLDPYHLNIWSPRQWDSVLRRYFAEVQAYQHWYEKPGVQLHLFNTPAETVLNERDFFLKPVALAHLYSLPTLSAVFVARKPVAAPRLPQPGQPVRFVDDSFTRSPRAAWLRSWRKVLVRVWRVSRQIISLHDAP